MSQPSRSRHNPPLTQGQAVSRPELNEAGGCLCLWAGLCVSLSSLSTCVSAPPLPTGQGRAPHSIHPAEGAGLEGRALPIRLPSLVSGDCLNTRPHDTKSIPLGYKDHSRHSAASSIQVPPGRSSTRLQCRQYNILLWAQSEACDCCLCCCCSCLCCCCCLCYYYDYYYDYYYFSCCCCSCLWCCWRHREKPVPVSQVLDAG